jgi:hypothetical protein
LAITVIRVDCAERPVLATHIEASMIIYPCSLMLIQCLAQANHGRAIFIQFFRFFDDLHLHLK